MYNTKIEYFIDEFISYLYWVGIIECVIWIVSLALFVADFSNMSFNWFFIPHCPRAIIGFFIIYLFPKTYQVIESLDYTEQEESLDVIQIKMKENYVNTLQSNNGALRIMLIFYFSLTIFCLLIDVILFFVKAARLSNTVAQEVSYVGLLIVVLYIGN